MGDVCDRYCRGCYYYKQISEHTKCCIYIFVTGHKRPCDPGTGCTEKVSVKGKRKRKMKGNGKNE